MMRAYVDTNILVDLVLSRQEFLPDAQPDQGSVPLITRS